MSTLNKMEQTMRRRALNDIEKQSSMKSIATSKFFAFVVGPEETEFTIHSTLVAKQSPVMSILVNGRFKEASEQRVKWTDLDEAIFLSFWEFAYTGDYENPSPEEEEEEKTDSSDDELAHWSKSWALYVRLFPRSAGPTKVNPTRDRVLWEDFVEEYAPMPRPFDVGNIGSDTLLHHARVCAFADRYCMDGLMEISMGKLFLALEATIPWGDKWNTIMDLLVFCSGRFVPERLRRIVADYVICQGDLFRDEEAFQNFLQDPGCSMRELLQELRMEDEGDG